MPEWIPIFALPNVKVQNPIEVDGIALVGAFDPRIKELQKKYKNYGLYLRRFKTEFGRKVSPSTLMVRDDTPPIYRQVDALSSFRDIVSISTISPAWARIFEFGRGAQAGPQYSDTFKFYPWMLDKNYQHVGTRSMALLGFEDDVKEMRAQSSPATPITWLIASMVDEPLLSALLKRWQVRYSGRSPSWKDRALFRSLNMANAAAMLPGHAEITDYDIGRHASLWVSAFEILAHPKNADSGFKQVYRLLEKASWKNSHCNTASYQAYFGRNSRSLRTLPCWIYGELNHARNDFLHGNPVRPNRLTTKRSKRGLFFFAPLLFRMALTAYLGLKWKEKFPKKGSVTDQVEYSDRKFTFEAYQRAVEMGISAIRLTEEEQNNIRNGKIKATAIRWP